LALLDHLIAGMDRMAADGSANGNADTVLRRRLQRSAADGAAAAGGAVERAWDIALRRAAQDMLSLRVDITGCRMRRLSVAELLELPGARSLIGILDGPGEKMGVIVLSPEVMSGLIEVQTLGQVSPNPPMARKPTRTDAAMVAGFFDAALAEMEMCLHGTHELGAVAGFRYASFLDDPRPLGLMLEDVHWQVAEADMSLANGVKTGRILLALPAQGQGADSHGEDPREAQFSAALMAQLGHAECKLDAILLRLSIDLTQMMALGVEDVLLLPGASLDLVQLETPDGRRMATGRLGQARGMRALRLAHVENDPGNDAAAPAPDMAAAQEDFIARTRRGQSPEAGHGGSDTEASPMADLISGLGIDADEMAQMVDFTDDQVA
jgi:flagellar motor switch protein FliM